MTNISKSKTVKIPLTQGKYAVIDARDYKLVNSLKWHYDNGRALTSGKTVDGKRGKKTFMYRLILGVPDGVLVDHIDGNPLNNTRSNLRVTNNRLNTLNRGPNKNSTSGLKGVYWHKHRKLWASEIRANGKLKSLGYFTDKYAAAAAYQKEWKNLMRTGYAEFSEETKDLVRSKEYYEQYFIKKPRGPNLPKNKEEQERYLKR